MNSHGATSLVSLYGIFSAVVVAIASAAPRGF
jgi:hypothetical protein